MFSSRWVIDPSTFSVPSDSSLWWIAVRVLIILMIENYKHNYNRHMEIISVFLTAVGHITKDMDIFSFRN